MSSITDTDRLFVLASRGATLDADAAINGRGIQPAQHFSVGKTYRLRFTHISLDDVKHVRLLLNGKPVMWRPFAKDGATLPAANRVETEAKQRMDVGETYDFEWTPAAPGVYVLEVATDYYPARGTTAMQRIAFGVGPSPRPPCAWRQPHVARGWRPIEHGAVELAGAYVSSTTAPSPDVVSVWPDSTGLAVSRTVAGVESPAHCLMPLADGSFVPGTCENGFMKEAVPVQHFRFDGSARRGGDGRERAIVPARRGTEDVGRRACAFRGRHSSGSRPRSAAAYSDDELRPAGGTPGRDLAVGTPISALSPSRFVGTAGPFAGVWEFAFKDGKVAAVSLLDLVYGFTANRVDREP